MLVQEPFWTVDTMFYTEMKMDNLAKFIYHFINSQDVASMNVGSAVPSLTTEILNNIELKIPSTSILKKYEEQVSVLYDKKNHNIRSIKNIESLRESILPKLLKGELCLLNN
jgi:type I restriction enzyme S subunit